MTQKELFDYNLKYNTSGVYNDNTIEYDGGKILTPIKKETTDISNMDEVYNNTQGTSTINSGVYLQK